MDKSPSEMEVHMNRDKQNQEGYDDPTAYEAITNIEQEERALRAFRPIVYICSHYSGDAAVRRQRHLPCPDLPWRAVEPLEPRDAQFA